MQYSAKDVIDIESVDFGSELDFFLLLANSIKIGGIFVSKLVSQHYWNYFEGLFRILCETDGNRQSGRKSR